MRCADAFGPHTLSLRRSFRFFQLTAMGGWSWLLQSSHECSACSFWSCLPLQHSGYCGSGLPPTLALHVAQEGLERLLWDLDVKKGLHLRGRNKCCVTGPELPDSVQCMAKNEQQAAVQESPESEASGSSSSSSRKPACKAAMSLRAATRHRARALWDLEAHKCICLGQKRSVEFVSSPMLQFLTAMQNGTRDPSKLALAGCSARQSHDQVLSSRGIKEKC